MIIWFPCFSSDVGLPGAGVCEVGHGGRRKGVICDLMIVNVLINGFGIIPKN